RLHWLKVGRMSVDWVVDCGLRFQKGIDCLQVFLRQLAEREPGHQGEAFWSNLWRTLFHIPSVLVKLVQEILLTPFPDTCVFVLDNVGAYDGSYGRSKDFSASQVFARQRLTLFHGSVATFAATQREQILAVIQLTAAVDRRNLAGRLWHPFDEHGNREVDLRPR